MGAPKGNDFWTKRSKHGRDKIFESPEILKDACYEYFKHESKQQWREKNWVGKEAKLVYKVVSTPFTLAGLCIFLGITTQTWNNYKGDYHKGDKKDFIGVITHIEDIIYKQKFDGAATGAYNPNIIARDLGLKDKSEVEQKTTTVPATEDELLKAIEEKKKELGK